MAEHLDRITEILCEIGKISGIDPDTDFYEAGFSSVNALQLLLEVETAYEVTIPDDEFIVARTPKALQALVARLKQDQRS